MVLNKIKSALLKVAIAEPENFFYWLNKETDIIGDEEYSAIRQDFLQLEEDYLAAELFFTNEDGTVTQVTGIDQFPVPPKK